jgi:ubiquinone/menaquinone biosynthesis C-methylase UbiE
MVQMQIYWDRRYQAHKEQTVGNMSFSREQFEKVTEKNCELIREHFGKYINSPVLDYGCGYGRHVKVLKEFAKDIHGLDINQWAIDQAHMADPEGQYWYYRGGDFPFSDKTFRSIMSWTVLQHVPLPEIFVVGNEIDRVLIPGGHVLLFENVTEATGHDAVFFRPAHFYKVLFKNYLLVKEQIIYGIDGNAEKHALIILEKPEVK